MQGAHVKGSDKALVAVIEYSDFQCPFCGRFSREVLPELDAAYVETGKVVLAFRHFPLDRIHPLAIGAAQAAECGGAQDKFWEFHDVLFQADAQLDPAGLLAMAGRAGLERTSWQDCFGSEPNTAIASDIASARALGITGTPYFLIGLRQAASVKVTKVLTGAMPVAAFREALDATLALAPK